MEAVIRGNRNDGRLVKISASAYRGERRCADGRMDSRIFRDVNAKEAAFQWETWKEAGARSDIAANAARVKAKLETPAPKQVAAEKGEAMAKADKTEAPPLYVLTIVGGGPLYVFDGEDKAFAVCDALTAAAKMSGFAAKYDVSEVKRWAE